MHGSRTHQSVRNVKSTRGYVRADVIKGQRGMMGIECFFFHTSQMFRGYWMLIRKLCKYLCAPANITEDTVAISQRFHVVKVWKIHTLENPLNKAASRKCGSFAKPKFRDGSTRNEIHIRLSDLELEIRSTTSQVHATRYTSVLTWPSDWRPVYHLPFWN